MLVLPRALRLPLSAVRVRDGLARLVARRLRPDRGELPRVVHAYAFKCDERAFARELLGRRTQLWIWRAHQAAACGDFVVVDLSAARTRRTVVVVDLKRGAPLRAGGPGAWQMRDAELVLDELEDVVDACARVERLTGDADALLAHFGA